MRDRASLFGAENVRLKYGNYKRRRDERFWVHLACIGVSRSTPVSISKDREEATGHTARLQKKYDSPRSQLGTSLY